MKRSSDCRREESTGNAGNQRTAAGAIAAALVAADGGRARVSVRQPKGGRHDGPGAVHWLGEVVRGRERKAVEVFNESLQYHGGLQQEGKVERRGVVSCSPWRRSCRLHPVARGARAARRDSAQRGVRAAPDAGVADRRSDRRDPRLYGRGARTADGPVPGRHGRPGRIALRAAQRALGRRRCAGVPLREFPLAGVSRWSPRAQSPSTACARSRASREA